MANEKWYSGLERVGKEIWGLVSDYQYSLDVWKIGGIAAFVFSAFLSVTTMNLINVTFELMKSGKDISQAVALVGIAAGLVTGFITVGTFLMGQSHNVDKAQIAVSNGGQ